MTDYTSTNGCGVETWLGVTFRPPHAKFFERECTLHDELYNIGGTEADRLKADRRLHDGMVAHATSHFKGRKVVSEWWFLTLAMIYYYAIRLLGSRHFNYHD